LEKIIILLLNNNKQKQVEHQQQQKQVEQQQKQLFGLCTVQQQCGFHFCEMLPCLLPAA
jgi:hypothetical protein